MIKGFFLFIFSIFSIYSAVSQCIPTAPTAINNCNIGHGSVQLGVSGSTGYYNWYDAATGGNLINTGSSYTTPFLTTTTNYYVAAASPTYALQLDGSNDYVALNMSYTTLGQVSVLTLEAWIKTSESGTGNYDNWSIIDFDRSDYYNFFVRGDNGQVGFSTTDNTSATDDFYSGTGNEVNDGEWHHIAAVYDGTDKIIYIDGIEVARNVNAHSGNNLGVGSTRFGFIGDGSEATSFNGGRNNLYYNGDVDEARIWHTVRTPVQINTYKDSCLLGSEVGLIAYYDFNEGTGSTINDLTGNGNTGTMFNFPASPWIANSPAICLNCESNRTTVTATISGATGVNLGSDLCLSGGSQILDAGVGYANYLWSTGESTQTISVSSSGTYWVQVDDGGSCSDSDTINVSFISAPTGNDTCLIGSGSTTLTVSGSTGYYNWYDAPVGGNLLETGSTFQTPVLSSTTSYYVSATDTFTGLEFDGTNDYIALNMSYTSSIPQLSVEAWVKTSFVGSSYTDNWAIIDFDRSDYYNLYIRGDNGQVGFSTTDVGSTIDDFDSGVGNSVNDGQWHHIAAVYDGTDKIIYIDGVEVARRVNAHSGSNLGVGSTRFGFIGDGSEATSFNGSRNNIYYDGVIDEVRIWHTTRSGAQINSVKDVCLAGNESGLAAYYKMDEASGTTLNDLSGNNNNGTLYNFSLPTAWVAGGPTQCSVCESPRTTLTVTVSGGSSMLGSQLTCGSSSVTLDAGAGFSSYLWSTGESTQTINVSSAGIYTVDVSGLGCSGTDTTSVTGFTSSENSLIFDGSNDYAAIEGLNYVGSGHQEMTVETWLKTTDGTDQIISSFDRNQFWRFEINGSGAGTGQVGFDLMTSSGQLDFGGTTRVDDGNWHHVAAVFDNGTVSIYIDGVLDATTTTGATFGSNATRYGFIGTGSEASTYNGTTGPSSYFNGEMDEFRIWNVARTQAEIRSNMCTHVSGGTTGLEVYYKFDETAGTKIYDYATLDPQNANMFNFPASPRVVSGASIGDLSSNLYTATWSGQSVNLLSCSSDQLQVNNVSGNPDGVHVYYINNDPNSTNGLASYTPNNHYYGVFVANGTSPSFNVAYSYPNHPLYAAPDEEDLILLYRSDNTATLWDTTGSSVNTSLQQVEANAQTQNEFILDKFEFNWTGATNTDWGTASNWSINRVPFSNSPVTIPNVTNKPVLDVDRSVGNVTVETSSLIDFNGFNFSVSGNATIDGSLTFNGGTMIFNGISTQTINTGTLLAENITINNSNGVTLSSGAINLSGTLTLTLGQFSTNNALTLTSNASGTARIAEITGGSITGNVTMQRYIDAGATDWRFFSSAINNTALSEFNDDFTTSGFTGSDFPDWPTAANPWPSIYFYDESQAGSQDNGFNPATNITNTLTNGEGIWVWCGDTSTGTQPFTIDVAGTVNTGSINLPVSYTNSGNPTEDGWSMVGNPYPSTIDWDSPGITKSGINNAIYIWNPDLQQFASYVSGIGTNGGSRYIASTQGFWVQGTSAGPSIQVTEASKSAVDASFLKTNTTTPLFFTTTNNFGSDEMAINFNDNASIDFDPMFDAGKLSSVNTNLPYVCSVLADGTDLSVNQLPEEETTIPVKVLTGASGIHTLTIDNVDQLMELNCLYLEDLFTGITYDLFSQQNITAYLFDTTTVARFMLHIGTTTNISVVEPTCTNASDGVIVVENNGASGFETTLTDSEGNIIANNLGNQDVDSLTNLVEGVYYLTVNDLTCGAETDTLFISAPSPITANYNYVENGLELTFTNNSTNGVSYEWDFGDGTTSNDMNPIHEFQTEGTYYVSLTVYQSETCYETYSEWINIITTSIEDIEIEKEKVWLNDNVLTIENPENRYDRFQVKTTLGQILIDQNFENQTITKYQLQEISNQVLIVVLSNDIESKTVKIPFIK